MQPRLKISIRVLCGEDIAMGPGKADLLEAIIREGSISGAGRAMGMSYRRAWLLVDMMNRCWASPLVSASPGHAGRGGSGGGARVTEAGLRVLAHYRALQSAAGALEQGADWQALTTMLRACPLDHQSGRAAAE
ncbi:MAG TPA: ModE family transcriptional regulator [Novosphingobium sp.]|nr:ModE family transcriptional regulator [Novosphingobium sp.]